MKPTIDDVVRARRTVEPFVHRTPVVTSASLDAMTGARLFFKAENLQRTGAFKYRGATNAVQGLADDAAARGVVTHSSGNHGAALARAATERGIPAWIVMPSSARAVKRAAVASYGGVIVDCEPTQASRESTAERVRRETGATLVHPYKDPGVIAGQGTVAAELFEQVDDLDVVVVPLGGGGLIAGTAIVARALHPRTSVVGVEPSGADDARRSLEAGRVVPVQPQTVADGLRATIGEPNLAILLNGQIAIVAIPDASIAAAQRLLLERTKLVVEPSGAVGLAAVLESSFDVSGRRIGLILSGGNVELSSVETDS